MITLHDPLDLHVHLRHNEMLKLVAPLTAKHFSAALVMPNIQPPIFNWELMELYRNEIYEYCNDDNFKPYMTGYFSTEYTETDLFNFKHYGALAIKFYPKGMTTNSGHGCYPDDQRVEYILRMMEELEIPLCVHAEAEGYHEDREILFHKYIKNWTTWCPKLKIIIEHISDSLTLDLLNKFENIFGTITAHHLLITGDDVKGHPHLDCNPVAKYKEDKELLINTAINNSKIMFGSDSAPHPKDKKESADFPAGCFTAPIALQLLTEVINNQNIMQEFVSNRAKRIYNLTNVPKKTVQLIEKPFVIPDIYGNVVPIWAGQTLKYSITSS